MSTNEGSKPVPDLVAKLEEVDESSPKASANETTISNNNGGRVELEEDVADDGVIKK